MSLNALKLFAKNAWVKKNLHALRDLSIKRKLTLIIMLTGGVAILLACAAFVTYDLMSFRDSMVRSLAIQAEMISANSSAALAFGDEVSAERELMALSAVSRIISACIFDNDGKIIAKYHRNNEIDGFTIPERREEGHIFTDDYLMLFRRIVLIDETLGMLYIQSDLQELQARLEGYAGIVAVFIFASISVALLLSSILQRVVTEPISHLAETAKIVSSKKDYSVRAAKHSNDELGFLIDGFNEMLTQIQKRDSALQKAHDELEKRVKERTKDLQQEVIERKRAEEAVRKSDAKNRALLDAIPDLILRIRQDGNFLDYKAANDGEAAVVLDAEFKGKSVDEMMPQKAAQQIMLHVQQALKTNEIQVIEYQLPVKGADVDCEARIVVSGEDEVVAIVRDITERKRVERMKNEFVSTVSHELRTPLTSIRGALGLIAGGVTGELPSKARSLLDIAYNNSERLVRLINDILDIEKIESGMMNFKIEPMELMPLIEQAVEANRAYGKEFGVRIAIEQSLPGIKVKADSDRLIQVMTNLLSNAIKFSPADGTVKVSVSRYFQSIRVAITDQGNGIPEEFRGKIFQKFAQADSSDTRQKGGTGLGLNICKAIIERLDGKIDFETKAGVGASFYFDLPEWHEQEVVVVSDREPQHKPGILICEDDRDVATLLGMMLQEGGFHTDYAYDAEQAKELLERSEYAAMTLDIMLPGQDGISLIRDLRTYERTRHLPIVVVSAKAKEGSKELNGNALGIIDWLEKPIDQNRLMTAVKLAASRLTGARPRILHVEDDPDIPKVVSMMLNDSADIDCASTLRDATKKLKQEHFDLTILDIELPDGNGLDLLPLLNSMAPPIPVIIFSAQEVAAECAQNVAAALVKSRHTNEALRDSIRSLITHVGKKAEPVAGVETA